MEILAEKYILLDSLLFKIVSTPEKEAALLALPRIYADKMIKLYHSNLFTGHHRLIQTYLTINDKYTNVAIYLLCKCKKLRTLVASFVLQQVRE